MNRIGSLLLLLALFLFSASCSHVEKEEVPVPDVPVDYRDQYIGWYDGTQHNHSWSISGTNFDTTFACSFEVKIDSGIPGNIIVGSKSFPIDSVTNSYYEMPYPGQIYRFDYRNDSAIVYTRGGGLGGYFESTISGKKR